jgi:hypothetical protein
MVGDDWGGFELLEFFMNFLGEENLIKSCPTGLIRKQEAGSWLGSGARIQHRNWLCVNSYSPKDSVSDCMSRIFQASPILCCPNTKLSFLYMVVSGMAIKAARILLFPKQGQIGGWRKSERTVKGTSSMHPN